MSRLTTVLSDSDLLAQILRGVPLLLLALWLVAPWWDAFSESTAFHHLLLWAPAGVWSGACLLIASLHVYSIYTQAWRLRQMALMGSALWWGLLVGLGFTDGEAYRPATALLLGNCITAALFYVRLGLTPHHGSMAEGPADDRHEVQSGSTAHEGGNGGRKAAHDGEF